MTVFTVTVSVYKISSHRHGKEFDIMKNIQITEELFVKLIKYLAMKSDLQMMNYMI